MLTYATGAAAEERRLVPHAQDEPDGVHPPVVEHVPADAAGEDGAVLRAGDDVKVVPAAGDGDQAGLANGRCVGVLLTVVAGADIHVLAVAPHYFKAADLEQLATGDKKMPKTIGSAGENART